MHVFKFRVVFSLTLFFVLVFAFGYFFHATEAGFDDNISGWAWSENIGWFSLNNVDPQFSQDYGVRINPDNSISGYAWLGPAQLNTVTGGGWLVFGSTVSQVVGTSAVHSKPGGVPGDALSLIPNNAPGGGGVFASLNSSTNEISGWARFVSLWDYGHNVVGKDDWGWVKLSGNGYGLKLNGDTREIEGYAWSGGGTSDTNQYLPEAGYGWIHFTGVGLDTAVLSGYVCDDKNTNGVCDVGEPRFEQALVTADKGGHRTTTLGDPQKGFYSFNDIRLNDSTKTFSANFTATFVGCSPQTYSVSFSNSQRVVTRDFPLDCSGNVSGGSESISGRVYEDLNGNGTYDSADLALSGVLVYTDQGQTAFSNTSGKYEIFKLAAQSYTLTPSAPGYVVGTQTKSNPVTASETDVDFIMVRGDDYSTKANLPWVQTLQGDVYVKGTVAPTVRPPRGYANATYMITAQGDIERFNSYSEDFSGDPDVRKQDWTIEQYGGPLPESLYGGVNFDKLKNSAGNVIPVTQQTADYFQGTDIYYRNGDLEIMGGEFGEGAHTVLVEGDLIMRGDTAYPEGAFARDELPVVSFIVKGNVYFENGVRRAVGNYYSFGSVNDMWSGSNNPNQQDIRLIIEGLLIGDSFSFERQITHDPQAVQYVDPVFPQPSFSGQQIDNSYSDPEIMNVPAPNNVIHFDAPEFESPSVLIFYDGRVIINTPPGLEDVSGNLPKIWKEVAVD